MSEAVGRLTLDEARRRYREERDKRLRADGLDQYVHTDGDLERFAADPWVTGDGQREPITTTADAVMLGAGMASLLAAVNLQKAGLKKLMLIDKAGDVGGTWYWNRYPGAQCDTESYVYLPLLEETGYIPTEKYAHQPELLEHLQRVARHYDLYRDALFQTQITQAQWSDEASTWTIRTNRGDVITTRYFIVAPGRLQSVKLPGIKGLETFQGKSCHTGRFDWDYAGANLENLADKRVGVIGTGATGIQVVPALAKAAKEVYVFQRTPAAPWERNNCPTPDDFGDDLEPGWQHRRMRNFTSLSTGFPAPAGEGDMVDDGWTDIAQRLASAVVEGKDVEEADLAIMERIRARVDEVVKDPATAAALKPYYRYGCKRPNFHDEFLASFNRPNTHLVDTHGRGPDEITERGVVVEGEEYGLDVLIFASGYDLGMGFLYGTGLDIVGRDGEILAEKWASGMRTFHGLLSHGFPNLFVLGFTQTAFSVSYTHMAAEQTAHLGYLVEQAERRGGVLEASAEAEAEYVATIRSGQTPDKIAFLSSCTPGGGNNEGRADDPNTLGAGAYPIAGNAFFDLIAQWRDSGTLEGIVFNNIDEGAGVSVH